MTVNWTDYLKYRTKLRGFELEKIEKIVRFSTERYFDNTTNRFIVVGRHGKKWVSIPYERENDSITPITIHATTRKQINFRIKSGRYRHE